MNTDIKKVCVGAGFLVLSPVLLPAMLLAAGSFLLGEMLITWFCKKEVDND